MNELAYLIVLGFAGYWDYRTHYCLEIVSALLWVTVLFVSPDAGLLAAASFAFLFLTVSGIQVLTHRNTIPRGDTDSLPTYFAAVLVLPPLAALCAAASFIITFAGASWIARTVTPKKKNKTTPLLAHAAISYAVGLLVALLLSLV